MASGRGGAIFRRDVARFSDVRAGAALTGRITNVVDFGAFVDVGVGSNGLVHASRLGKQWPRVGDRVEVKVIEVDEKRRRIGLALEKIL